MSDSTDVVAVPERGDRYVFPARSNPAVLSTVLRVSKTGGWADVESLDLSSGSMWRKRQPLPLPGEVVPR